MRQLCFIAFFLALVSFARAQNSSIMLKEAMEKLPPCALGCFISEVARSSCQISDLYCISRNEELNAGISSCTRAHCTIKESLVAKNFSETAYGRPVRSHSALTTRISLVGGGIAIIAVIVRIIARLPYLGGTWGQDDWTILVTMIPVVTMIALAPPIADAGLGTDIWTVSFDNITRVLHMYYFEELLYISAISLTKIAILLFYLRIFPSRSFRRLVYIIITICIMYLIGFLVTLALQCLPVSHAWRRWDGEHEGSCINLNMESWIGSALNITLDLVVMLLPLHELSRLRLSLKKKASVMLMFLGGILVTIISILRLRFLIQFANSDNVTWDYTPIGYWSTLEVNMGIVIACLPALRSLQYRIFPDNRPSTGYSKSSNSKNTFTAAIKKFNIKRPSQDTPLTRGRPETRDSAKPKQTRKNKSSKGEIRIEIAKMNPLRGSNSTHVRRGSFHAEEDALPPTPGMRSFSTLPLSAAYRRDSKTSDTSSAIRSPNTISVRRDYSVTIEETADERSPSPPRRVHESNKVRKEKRHSRRKGESGSRSLSRDRSRPMTPKRSQRISLNEE